MLCCRQRRILFGVPTPRIAARNLLVASGKCGPWSCSVLRVQFMRGAVELGRNATVHFVRCIQYVEARSWCLGERAVAAFILRHKAVQVPILRCQRAYQLVAASLSYAVGPLAHNASVLWGTNRPPTESGGGQSNPPIRVLNRISTVVLF